MSLDQVSGIAGGATGAPLGGITGTLQGGINNLTNMGSGFLDKWFPPEKREELKSKLMKFATEKPALASFIFSQIALSGLPLLLFIILTVTVAIFALLTGILVGVIGALLFVVGALILALFILLPTLFVTTFFAVAVWLWGLGAYYIVKGFNEKSIPGIHVPLKDGLQNGLKGLPGLNGDTPTSPPDDEVPTKAPPKHEKHEKAHKKKSEKSTPAASPKPQTNGSADAKSDHHTEEKDTPARERHAKKSEPASTKTPNPVGDVGGAVGSVGKGLTG